MLPQYANLVGIADMFENIKPDNVRIFVVQTISVYSIAREVRISDTSSSSCPSWLYASIVVAVREVLGR